ncbi:hypothetical protein B0H15DRAFT_933946 [Mycena belliarum]|uniref:Uncharacterized protein n=1 Tax=Mycena belliarum TaxID=1033014 RepID=A0AAD6TU04_9AGAR|nr:hypothetical protein B0H15DRAFT_933946 [Mycena belliae]
MSQFSETSLYRAPDSETATPSSLRFPQELCDEIMARVSVEFDPDIESDREGQEPYLTLRQCALVCSAWLPSARSHIFRVVRLLTYDATDRLLEVLTLNTTLAQYMTCLMLAAKWIADWDVVAGLAPKLTAVKELYLWAESLLDGHRGSGRDFEAITNLTSALSPVLRSPKLAVMYLTGFSFASKDEFRRFISFPSSLDILAIKDIHLCNTISEADPGYAQRQSRIQISDLGLPWYDARLASWLLHPSFPIAVALLTRISIRVDDVGDMRDVLPLLNEVGSSLKEFELYLHGCNFRKHRLPSIMDAMPTLPNTNLEHLTIRGLDRMNPFIVVHTERFDGAEFVQALLSRLSAPQNLQRLTIREFIGTRRYDAVEELPKLEWHNWQAVDDLLSKDSFTNVRYLDFFAEINRLELGRDVPVVRSYITPQFSAFRGRRGSHSHGSKLPGPEREPSDAPNLVSI